MNISALLLLLFGGAAAVGIYVSAPASQDSSLVDGFLESKIYHRDLERYGGKLNVVSDELIRWFRSLWQGEMLAFTIAIVTLSIALLLLWLARRIPTAERSEP